MRFEITHVTDYRYEFPASEAYIEARLAPPERASQQVLGHRVRFEPEAPVSSYRDYFGNNVAFYSMVKRHRRLSIRSEMAVRTSPPALPEEGLELTVGEARQIFSSALTDVFDYLRGTTVVPTGGEAARWSRRHLPSSVTLREALGTLNRQIHEAFVYRKGTTDVSTPLQQIWRERVGVCQDFAHVMLSVLRTTGLPSRYVCGYIETDPPAAGTRLIGAVATHAWVEVLVPGMEWVALDPTNNQWCGERHVAVSFGRDFRDATPVRGTFKGSGEQKLEIKVRMRRVEDRP